MLDASKVGNLESEFGYARPLGSRVIRYVRDGQTDGQTKATLTAPFPAGGGKISNGFCIMSVNSPGGSTRLGEVNQA